MEISSTPPRADLEAIIEQDRLDEFRILMDHWSGLPSWTGGLQKRLASPPYPLLLAARSGSICIIDAILDAGGNIGVTDKAGRPALFHAMMAGQWDAASRLVDRGADIHCRSKQGTSSLMLALRGDHRAWI